MSGNFRNGDEAGLAMLDGMVDAVLLLDSAAATVVHANPAAISLFGARAVAVGATLGPLWQPMWTSLQAARCWRGTLQLDSHAGEPRWLAVSASCLDSDAPPERVLAVCRDISDEHAVYEAWRESERLRQSSLRLAQIGHWRIDAISGDLSGTDELYQIFELPRTATLEDFDRVVHPDDRETLNQIMQTTLQNQGFYDSTYRLVTPSGKRKWVHAIGEGVLDRDGLLIEIVGSVQDITAFHRVEEELQKMQRLESLGVLAGGIAHDFNNILTALFGNLSLARSKLEPGSAALPDLLAAEKAMQRAVNLSNQLLTFAKGGEPVKKALDLLPLVRDITRFDLAGSAVRLQLQADPDLWQVAADQGQLEQVFGNLVINARQAMPHGGVLHVELHNVQLAQGEHPALAPGDYVQVRVRDEGEGIADAHLGQVFDPYFSTRELGSGLGLATVWSIMKRHRGHVEVASTPGAGAEFTLYLPVAGAARAPEAAVVAPQPVQRKSTGRILVMDDEPAICELVSRMLERQGHVVETVPDGAQAIERYCAALQRGERFDCVLMDLTIPGGMGGKDTLRELLRHDPAVVALVSSGYGVDPVMANPAAYGFKGVIPKPYNLELLTQAVARVLGESPT